MAKYGGTAGTARQYKDLEKVLTRGMADIEHTTSGPAPLQLMKNVLSAYTQETYFGGTGYSVLNTNLRDQKEYPAMAAVAQLFHHAVSELAASDEYGFDGMALRAMNLPPDVISQ
jgi:predicted NAD/FAD-binding protein